jgi:hypothetical protein
VDREWSWLLTSIVVVKNGGAIPPLPHTSLGTTLPFFFTLSLFTSFL